MELYWTTIYAVVARTETALIFNFGNRWTNNGVSKKNLLPKASLFYFFKFLVLVVFTYSNAAVTMP